MDAVQTNRSFKEYLTSGVSGFAMGVTAPITGGAATVGMRMLGAGLSMASGSVVGQSIETGTVSFKQTLTDGLLGAAFGAVGEGIASSGILGKAFNFGKKKILGLVDDFIPKGPAAVEAGTGMKMSADVAENMGKVELGKIEQTAVQKNYNAVMNPSKAIASTTDDVAEQVLVKSADDVAGRAVVSSADNNASQVARRAENSLSKTNDVAQRVAKSADDGVEAMGSVATKDIKVIGRLEDTAVARDWKGHDVLNDPNWTLAKNDDWVNIGIKNKQDFYVASPVTEKNLISSNPKYPGETVFARELRILKESGYVQKGDYLIHPENLK